MTTWDDIAARMMDYQQTWMRDMITRLEAEEAERRAWVLGLAAKYGVVLREETLTEDEIEAQRDRVDRALGLKFYTTTPLPGLFMHPDGTWEPM